MNRTFLFEDEQQFLNKLRELAEQGVEPDTVSLIMPYNVAEADKILNNRLSSLKYFPLSGAIFGFLAGFGLTIFTALDWPIMTGGKPVVSIPAYLIIAFELTILFGALASFFGFLVLAKLPDMKMIISPEENDGKFAIILKTGHPDR